MSVEIYAFLGSNVSELASRLISSFEHIGFKVALHPDMDLLNSNPTGCLCLAILETPPTLKRVASEVPLLISFGFSVTRREISLPVDGINWPPKGVKTHAHEIYTRTSAGRSRSSYFMQAFTMAILAKETGGYVWCNGDAKAVSGNAAFKKVLAELNSLDASARQIQDLMESLEKKHGVAEANRFGQSMHDLLSATFDAGASPFKEWPSIENYDRFSWAEKICLPPFKEKSGSWWSRISLYWATVFIFLMLMVLVTVIYS